MGGERKVWTWCYSPGSFASLTSLKCDSIFRFCDLWPLFRSSAHNTSERWKSSLWRQRYKTDRLKENKDCVFMRREIWILLYSRERSHSAMWSRFYFLTNIRLFFPAVVDVCLCLLWCSRVLCVSVLCCLCINVMGSLPAGPLARQRWGSL